MAVRLSNLKFQRNDISPPRMVICTRAAHIIICMHKKGLRIFVLGIGTAVGHKLAQAGGQVISRLSKYKPRY
jgi:hypothetical protein